MWILNRSSGPCCQSRHLQTKLVRGKRERFKFEFARFISFTYYRSRICLLPHRGGARIPCPYHHLPPQTQTCPPPLPHSPQLHLPLNSLLFKPHTTPLKTLRFKIHYPAISLKLHHSRKRPLTSSRGNDDISTHDLIIVQEGRPTIVIGRPSIL